MVRRSRRRPTLAPCPGPHPPRGSSVGHSAHGYQYRQPQRGSVWTALRRAPYRRLAPRDLALGEPPPRPQVAPQQAWLATLLGPGQTSSMRAMWGVVAVPRAELEDPGVAAGALSVTGRDVGEQLVGHVLVADERDHLALVVDARPSWPWSRTSRIPAAAPWPWPQLSRGLRRRSARPRGCPSSPSGERHRRRNGGPSWDDRECQTSLLPLLPAEREAPLVELLEDLVEGLLPEVGDCQ